MRRPPLQLIEHPGAPTDVVDCLKELLTEARSGDLIGIAYAAMYRRRQYYVDATGECYRNPTFARGMVGALGDMLGRLARGEP